MSLVATARSRVFSSIVLSAVVLCAPAPAEANCCRIKIKKPRIVIGKPKVTVNPTVVMQNVATALGTAGHDVVKEGGTGANKVFRESKTAAENVATVALVAATDATTVALVAGGQTVDVVTKARRDAWAEALRAGGNLRDAGFAIGQFAEANVRGTSRSLEANAQRFREGKVGDVLFHLAVDPLRTNEKALFTATQQSTLLNTVAAAAASTYGPGGTAAYVAWQTYRATNGDADAALRAGILAGLTSAATSAVTAAGNSAVGVTPTSAATSPPTFVTSATFRKAIVAGAVGGIAVAAAGGDGDAVRDAFLWAGGMVVVQDGYHNFTGKALDNSPATGEPLCVSAVGPTCPDLEAITVRNPDGTPVLDSKGQPKLDYRLLDDSRRSMVGQEWTAARGKADAAAQAEYRQKGTPVPKPRLAEDRSAFMKSVAKIPGANAMGLFHDQWVAQWDMDALTNKATIPPAIVLTYIGTGAPLYDAIKNAVVSSAGATETAASVMTNIAPVAPPTVTTQRTRTDVVGGPCEQLRRTKDGQFVIPTSDSVATACEYRSAGDSLIAARNLGDSLVRVAEGRVYPAAGWEWVSEDSTKLAVRLRSGLTRTSGRKVRPAPGWVWVAPEDTAHFEVMYVPLGLIRTEEGALLLADGWEWLAPGDTTKVTRRLRAGLVLRSDGGLEPASGFTWVKPEDNASVAVRRATQQELTAAQATSSAASSVVP